MTDEAILNFLHQTRQTLDYIENGNLPFTDGEAYEHDQA